MLIRTQKRAPLGIAAALAAYSRAQPERGLRRVEVQARGEDAPLLHAVAAALTDPARARELRSILRDRLRTARPA